MGRVQPDRRGGVSDAGLGTRILPRRWHGIGARLQVPGGDKTRPATRLWPARRVMLGIVPGWGGIQASAASGGRARSAGSPAFGQNRRCATREEAGHRRRMRSGARHGQRSTRDMLAVALPPPRRAPAAAGAHAPDADVASLDRGAGAQASCQARAARTLSCALRHSRHMGEIRRGRARRLDHCYQETRRSRICCRRLPRPTSSAYSSCRSD